VSDKQMKEKSVELNILELLSEMLPIQK